MSQNIFIIRIKALRLEKGYSQYQLSRMLKVSVRAYCFYENGERRFPIGLLVQLSSIFETSVDYLLGKTDIQEPYQEIL